MGMSVSEIARLSPKAQRQILAAVVKDGRKNKFNAEKTVIFAPDGIRREFDSQKEAERFLELCVLLRAGKIKNLELQKEFELIPTQYEYIPRFGKNGRKLKDERRCIELGVKYIADFAYLDVASGKDVVEDCKGYRNPKSAAYAKFVIKRKLMLYIHGIRVKET